MFDIITSTLKCIIIFLKEKSLDLDRPRCLNSTLITRLFNMCTKNTFFSFFKLLSYRFWIFAGTLRRSQGSADKKVHHQQHRSDESCSDDGDVMSQRPGTSTDSPEIMGHM